MKIQKIFQIVISDEPVSIQNWTHNFQMNLESLKNIYPYADYHLFSNSELREFLLKNFEANILATYDKLKPYAFKADLARYCLLYIYGGLYSDLSYLHLNPIDITRDTKMVVFRDIYTIHPAWAISNAIIYSEPGRKELWEAIEMIVKNGRDEYYGESSLDVTGPYLFGRALAKVNCYQDIIFGDSRELTPHNQKNRNIYKILPTGDLIAYRNKKDGGQICDYGVKGTNSYATLWEQRQVWEKEEQIKVVSKNPFTSIMKLIRPKHET